MVYWVPAMCCRNACFKSISKEYKDKGVVFLGFTFEDKKSLKKFFTNHPFDFTIIPEAQNIEDLFGVLEHPVNFIIDQNGKVIMALGGGTGEEAKTYAYLKIKPFLENLLKK